jgi:AcrR family transcriptional regulator
MAKRPIDRRVARTRAILHEALISLITEKGYETITVEDICERANVGRSTFYAHYTGKDDLMRGGLNNLRNALVNQRNNASTPNPTEIRCLTFGLTMFEHARDHMHLHRTLVGNRGGTIAFDTIREMLSDMVRAELTLGTAKSAKDAVPREFVVQFLVGAYMEVMMWWLDSGAKLAPERMDAVFQSLAANGVANLSLSSATQ